MGDPACKAPRSVSRGLLQHASAHHSRPRIVATTSAGAMWRTYRSVIASRYVMAELLERLTAAGVTFTDSELSETFARMADAGQLVRVRRLGVEYLVHATARGWDAGDELAADSCATLKRHGEYADSDSQLEEFLSEDGVQYAADELDRAVQFLEWGGRLRRPRQDQWREGSPLPMTYVPPRPYQE
jgi:hypothetical protein